MDVKRVVKVEIPAKRRRISSSQGEKRILSSGFMKEAFKSMNEFRKDGYLCDVQITVSGGVITAHRIVLAARSNYFKEFFKITPNGSKIAFPGLTKDAVAPCINFMYTGEVVTRLETAEVILTVAKLFQLYDIFEVFFEYFTSNLSVKNCFIIKNVAEKFDARTLKNQAEKIIADNIDKLINDKEFPKIKRNDLIKFLNGCQNGSAIWTALAVWAGHDFAARKDDFETIFEALPMSKFSLEELIMMTNNSKVQTSQKCGKIIEKEILKRFKGGAITFTEQNWSYMRNIFRMCNLSILERTVNEYVLKNFQTVSKSQSFLEIEKEDLVFFLRSVAISKTTENTVWSALHNWVKYREERLKFYSELFKMLNLTKFSLNFIKNVIRKEPLVAADNNCLKSVVDALCSNIIQV